MSDLSPNRSFDVPRAERRISVRLPIEVSGTDRSGVHFQERTLSENLCRKGVAFVLSRELDLGANLDITILLPPQGREGKKDFATQGLVRHVKSRDGERVFGAEFIGPHFHRVFLSESSDGNLV
jgi:hypothetical protein